MNVQFTTTSRSKLDQLTVTNGQIICLSDDSAAYYDMGNVRHHISGLRIVDELPNAGVDGILYLNTTSSSLYVWNSTSSEFVNVGGKYSAGAGITLADNTNTFKTKLLSETKLANNASTVSEVANRVYAVSLDNSGNLAVNVPWTDNNTTYAVVSKTDAGLVPTLPNESSTAKYLCQDGNWAVPPNTTYTTVDKSSAGLCPVLPNETATSKYLRQDGSWATPPTGSTYDVVSKTAAGLAPQLPNETTTSKYLRQDGTWSEPPGAEYSSLEPVSGGTAVSLVTTGDKYNWNQSTAVVSVSAKGLAPKVTSTSGYLKGDGTWSTPTNTTYANVSTSAAGLAPKVTNTNAFLKGNGTWATPTNTTYANVSTSAAGLAPKVTNTSAFLKGDGTWATPTNTTYATVSTSAAGLAPAVTDTSKYLRGDGTWATPTNSTYTVNDGTLTIKKNGTTVATFTANQSGSSEADITCAVWTEISGTLASGSTLCEISNAAVTTSSTILAICADDATLQYTNATATTGKLSITFDAQSAAHSIKAYIV